MYKYSEKSKKRLGTVHPDLQRLFYEVIKHWDCTILEGRRTPEQQRKNIEKGVSKTMNSKHIPRDEDGNYDETKYAMAVDVAPYPLEWPDEDSDTYVKDLALFYYFSGFVLGIASQLDIDVRHGADWDGDREIKDQRFDDSVHFELIV